MRPFDPRLLKYAKTARKYIAFLVFLGIVLTLLTALQTLLIASALTPIFYQTGTLAQITWFLLWLGVVFLLRAGLAYLNQAIGHHAALRVIATLRTKILRHAGDLGPRWLSAGNTTRIVTLATRGLDDLEAYFVAFLPQLFLTVTATPALILIIGYLDWISAFAIVLCIPLIPLFMILIGKMTANYSAQRLQSMQHLGTQLLDLLSGIATLKALGREKGPEKRVRALGNAFTQKTMQTLYVAFLSGGVLEFLTTLSTAIVAVEVGFRMVAGNLLLFEGLVIIMLTPEVFKPLREVGTQFHASANGVAAAQQAFEILETPTDKISISSQALPDLRNASIRIENLSMYSPQRTSVAPANLTAVIHPQEITMLCGKSGAGKTTTIQLLLALLSPTKGQIFIGDTPLSAIDVQQWWQQITWVPQRPVLFPGSVAENLGINAAEINSAAAAETRLTQAAALTGFSEVLATLPNGYQTRIGHGGVGLSVGQRQRLALTRALLQDTQIVVLDEPSAHLDAVAEEAVTETIKTLKAQGRTVIVIAHRAKLTQLADQVIEIHADTRDITTELAVREQQLFDQAQRAKREQEKIDYALPSSWNKGTNQGTTEKRSDGKENE